MVKTKAEILESVKARIGDATDDESIAFIEDISDTLDSLETNAGVDWKQKYEDNDANWKKKYRDRFFGNPDPDEEDEKEKEKEKKKPMTFEDLFTVKGE